MIFHKYIENLYKARVFCRYDDKGIEKYFSHEDFPGLRMLPYNFKSSKGHLLRGGFYGYEHSSPSPLIVFDHGLGGGHRSYMKEIELLCSHGYTVFAYDHTGSMESDGDGVCGLSQSLCDLNDCLNTLKADNGINTSRIYVMGHSWGGYSTLNISALHPDVEKIVVIAGFISVPDMVTQNFQSFLKPYRKYAMALETESNPATVNLNAVETLKNSDVKALLIYSSNDHMVNREIHYDKLVEGLSDKENVTLMLVENKGHNPHYSTDAVVYLGELAKGEKNAKKLNTPEKREAFKNSFDWHKMTEQDPEIWAKIFNHLDN